MDKTIDCKVIMLPTETQFLKRVENCLCKNMDGNLCVLVYQHGSTGYEQFKPQHLYFTSQQKIYEGDWYYDSVENKIYLMDYGGVSEGFGEYATNHKVIASTDTELQKEGWANKVCAIPIRWVKEVYTPMQGCIDKVMLSTIGWKDFKGGSTMEESSWGAANVGKLKLTQNNEVIISKYSYPIIAGGELVIKDGIASSTPLKVVQKEVKGKSMAEQLREHIANTPKEQLEKEWKEIEAMGFSPEHCPSAVDFIESFKKHKTMEDAAMAYAEKISPNALGSMKNTWAEMFMAGWQANPNTWSDEDMKKAFQVYHYVPFPHNGTFEEWLSDYKTSKQAQS